MIFKLSNHGLIFILFFIYLYIFFSIYLFNSIEKSLLSWKKGWDCYLKMIVGSHLLYIIMYFIYNKLKFLFHFSGVLVKTIHPLVIIWRVDRT